MVKIFQNLRIQRNEALLDLLGIIVSSMEPQSPYTLYQSLGKEKVYSNIHTNIGYLEGKGFLTLTEQQTQGRKKNLYDVTVKGAIASLYSSQLTVDTSQLLKHWHDKQWGPRHERPFKNIKDVSEIHAFIRTMYLYGNSLVDIDEEFLQRGLRNPAEVSSLIADSSISFEKTIRENGEYNVNWTSIPPGSVAFGSIARKREKKNEVCGLIKPDEETSEILFEFFSKDPEYKRELGRYLLMILQTIAKNRVDGGKGTDASHYFPRSRSLILTATLPEKVVSLIEYPERVLDLTKNAYRDILKPFFESDAFVNEGKAWFTIRGFKYDPQRRDLSALSQEEINEKLPEALKRIS